DPEYQTDAKWWEAVVQHDELVERRREQDRPTDVTDDDVTREFREGLSGVVVFEEEEAEEEEQAEAGEEALTEEQRVGQLLELGLPLRELEGEFASTAVGGRPMRLRAFQVRGHPLNVGNRRVPVWITGERGGGFVAFVDIDHPHFRNFDDEPEDVVL